MGTKKWDQYEFRVAGHFLPAIINDDHSGLDGREDQDLRDFEKAAYAQAHASGFEVGHWATGDGETEWGECEICGLDAETEALILMVYRDGRA